MPPETSSLPLLAHQRVPPWAAVAPVVGSLTYCSEGKTCLRLGATDRPPDNHGLANTVSHMLHGCFLLLMIHVPTVKCGDFGYLRERIRW